MSIAETLKVSVAAACLAFVAVTVVALPMLARGLAASDPVDVNAVVETAVRRAGALARELEVMLDFSDPAQFERVFITTFLTQERAPADWRWESRSRDPAGKGALFMNLSLMGADYVVLDVVNTTEFFGDAAGFVNLSFYYRPVYPGHIASMVLETLSEDGGGDSTATIGMRDDGAAGTGDFEARTESVGNGWLFVTARNIAEIPKTGQMVLCVSNVPTVGNEPFGLYLKDVRMGVYR